MTHTSSHKLLGCLRAISTTTLITLAFSGCIETDPPITPNADTTDQGSQQPDQQSMTGTNTRPVASPGSSRTVNLGEEVVLDGSGSFDEDGDELSYTWSVTSPEGSSATLQNASEAVARFKPDVEGDYVISLVVNDGSVDSLSAELTITVNDLNKDNNPPVANAGVNRQVEIGQAVSLDAGNSSDPDGQSLTYLWELVSAPSGSASTISSADQEVASLTPDTEGMYQIRLIVNDGIVGSNPALLTLTAVPNKPANQAPVAQQTGDQSVEVGDTVSLDGSSSQDPDGQNITFSWTLEKPSGSGAFLSAPTASKPTFNADAAGTYTATLVVNDGELQSDPVSTTITAAIGNQAPTARVGMARNVVVGQNVQLDGDSSDDPDGDPLTFSWSLTSKPTGSSASMMDATTATPTFIPDVPGAYIAELTVSDGELQSSPASVLIDAVEPCLLISEYVEGSSNNKALEFYNCSGSTLSLLMIRTCLFSNSNTTCDSARPFAQPELADGGVTVLCNGAADSSGITNACAGNTSSVATFNGNDRIVVFVDLNANDAFDPDTDRLLDAFGPYGTPPGSNIWENVTYERCSMTPYDGISDFNPLSYFTEEPIDTTSNLGVAPLLAGCP